jgi:hypothetical protein
MAWPPHRVTWLPPSERRLAQFVRRQPQLARRIIAAVERYAATGYGDVRHLEDRPDYRLRVGT